MRLFKNLREAADKDISAQVIGKLKTIRAQMAREAMKYDGKVSSEGDWDSDLTFSEIKKIESDLGRTADAFEKQLNSILRKKVIKWKQFALVVKEVKVIDLDYDSVLRTIHIYSEDGKKYSTNQADAKFLSRTLPLPPFESMQFFE
jgi:pyruvate dehydrogenase complex dehydrogenase (E1) component